MKIPAMGFGTFRLEGDVAYQSVLTALRAGYRHIDTAQIYGNEVEVGKAIADSGIARSEIFLTTKVWNDNLSQEKFVTSVKTSLNKLASDYVDLLLIHWPAPPKGTSLLDATQSLVKAKEQGLTRAIGVSNFTIAQLEAIKPALTDTPLLTNQVEVHPYLTNLKLRAYCQQHNITVTGYMPFAVGKVLKDPVVTSIAKAHNCTPAQAIIAWTQANHLITIPSSTKAKNIEANLAGLSIKLTSTQLAAIDQLNCNERIATPDFSPEWD
ncbi:2,5-didehydrogluconate reductase DkgB [Thalassotalea sp. LPB0316]|uniref:2,5-didehydrogluconate reductase DkgB n=1 Tax=Thalassotalea sp. LPB0316 TaxID=2769490 RepID=UPI0018664FA6|nr:2,5-didehydrogluconate reductase DkgB [Thalassotalea sp. LPB0316]QOL25808.1 2,5-didehydrogluconate reductase DkgB [Thalassotalea sp. LPB0316]